mmetsp:Transcript_1714/g.3252  ORF Transcript_1714/g.3252 Transcript_1714/m.3252 type:complete len:107 (-) Transcript_1714:385-705(-)
MSYHAARSITKNVGTPMTIAVRVQRLAANFNFWWLALTNLRSLGKKRGGEGRSEVMDGLREADDEFARAAVKNGLKLPIDTCSMKKKRLGSVYVLFLRTRSSVKSL